jgi:hypothetical protein
MTYRVAVLDIRIADAHGPAALAAWRSAAQSVWVSGSQRTLVVDENEPQSRIVAWLRDRALIARERINIDLLCHGSQASDARRPMAFLAKLGEGLAVTNVRSWHPLLSLVNKIRLFSCGELNRLIGHAPDELSRSELCFQLAFHTGAPVISSPHSVVFALAMQPEPGTASAGVDALGWPKSPVYRYTPDRRQVAIR